MRRGVGRKKESAQNKERGKAQHSMRMKREGNGKTWSETGARRSGEGGRKEG
jgi:hypothetical protein